MPNNRAAANCLSSLFLAATDAFVVARSSEAPRCYSLQFRAMRRRRGAKYEPAVRNPTIRTGCVRSGNRRTKISPSRKTSFGVRSRWLNGEGIAESLAQQLRRKQRSQSCINLWPASERHCIQQRCRRTIGKGNYLGPQSHCSRQRLTCRRDQGLLKLFPTNRAAPRPTTVCSHSGRKAQSKPAQMSIDAI